MWPNFNYQVTQYYANFVKFGILSYAFRGVGHEYTDKDTR